MCGIAGVVYSDREKPVVSELIERMCAVIHHRGPDEWGMWTDGAIGLGMKRLRIIDLEGGSQPIGNADGSVWIVFNGEIYNYRELRSELEGKGFRFSTNTDTESILHLYEEFGEECLQKLRGMFAFAIWDGNKRKLFLARDRFGKKPLHYLADDKKLVFGSEIKSLLEHPEVLPEVNRSSLVNYLSYGYTIDPETMFKGIVKLPPGHCLIWENGRTRVRQYWDLKFVPDQKKSEKDFLREAEDILTEAVRIRLMSDVPLGAFLSGGIDSSLVVALMARQMSEPVKTFSIGFKEQRYNELPYARLVAERYSTDHHEEIVEPDAEAIIPHLLRVFDEPFADSSAIPTYYVSRLARRHVTVALSGDGGDELFGGYDRYLDSPLSGITDHIPFLVRKFLLGNFARLLPEGARGVNMLRYLAAGKDERYLLKMTGSRSKTYSSVFSSDLMQVIGNCDPVQASQFHLDKVAGCDSLTRRQYLDVKVYLASDILTKVDRCSMLVSLEARAPFLDHKVAEFAATLPPSMRIRGRTSKYLLKRLAENLLPPELIHRPKMGFAVPVSQWINREWLDVSQDLVLSSRALQRNNFNSNYLHRILNEHRRGRRDHGMIIWALMVLEMWYREYIDRAVNHVVLDTD